MLVIAGRYPERIEKYITGIVYNSNSKLSSIYANPEHMHFLASRSLKISEEALLSIVTDSAAKCIRANKLCAGNFTWQQPAKHSLFQKEMVIKCANTHLINEASQKISLLTSIDILLKPYHKT